MNYFAELQQTLAHLDPSPLLAFVQACEGTLWLAGNGGSAATAQHWACDLSKASGRRVQALGTNSAVLTAWANDADYEGALAMEMTRLAQHGDRLICLSCSGKSPNILAVLRRAYSKKMPRALVTGPAAPDDWNPYDVIVTVPHTHYGIIEDCHLAIGHWLTEALCSQ